ncbi:MAG: RusA family crossover junction endodeoxyribonuclease [Candidatus Polarisedimenticolia bacterium]
MALRASTSSPLLTLPVGLVEVASFSVGWVRTWGSGTVADAPYKAEAVQASGLSSSRPDGRTYLFVLRVYWQVRRTAVPRQRPDVENVAKLITDAFTGYLYEDDDLRFVLRSSKRVFRSRRQFPRTH